MDGVAFGRYFTVSKDLNVALVACAGKTIMGFEMKLGWGKPVRIPPQPLYTPIGVLKTSTPPPPSGLPFNAQPRDRFRNDFTKPWSRSKDEFEKVTNPPPPVCSRHWLCAWSSRGWNYLFSRRVCLRFSAHSSKPLSDWVELGQVEVFLFVFFFFLVILSSFTKKVLPPSEDKDAGH